MDMGVTLTRSMVTTLDLMFLLYELGSSDNNIKLFHCLGQVIEAYVV